MPDTTTNYGISYPIASDSVAPLHTAFSTLATSVEDALTEHLKPLSDNNKNYNYTVASSAEMAAIDSPPSGSTCFITGTKGAYLYDGVKWVLQFLPWTDYNPTNLFTTNGVTPITGSYTKNTAKYTVVGNIATVNIQVTFNATMTFTGLRVTLPLTSLNPVSQQSILGSGVLTVSGKYYPVSVHHTDNASAQIMYTKNTLATAVIMELVNMTNSAPVAVVNTNTLNLNFSYPLL